MSFDDWVIRSHKHRELRWFYLWLRFRVFGGFSRRKKHEKSGPRFLLGSADDQTQIFADFHEVGHFISAGQAGSSHASYAEGVFVTYLLQNYSPDELMFAMIDPKRVQLIPYDDIPYLWRPTAYTPQQAKATVSDLLEEVERRFTLLSKAGVRDIHEYNEAADDKLPFIILLATEIADLMMVDKSFYEKAFISLAQKSRAVGIHMYLATQRPSADVFTDMLIANIFGRLVFSVGSEIDSRRLLNRAGAEQIKKQGQFIYLNCPTDKYTTVQAPYVSDAEVARIVDQISSTNKN